MPKKQIKFICPKCGGEVSQKKKDISNADYFAACLNCDEDFFRFELKEII